MDHTMEKHGNTAWAQCPDCKGWLPVSGALLARPDVRMHCPHCHHEFTQPEAARVARP